MISFIKKHADWITIAFHSFVLFSAMLISITDMDISGWIFVFFTFYVVWVVYEKVKNTKTFKRYLKKLNIKK